MNRSDVGIVILGSQNERHGLLPPDTDTKLAAYVALHGAAKTCAKLVGTVNSAAEYDYIKHGRHFPTPVVVHDLKCVVENAIERLETRKFVVVNGHGGNKLISKHVSELAEHLDVKIAFNNVIVRLEGAHAASGECSMAVAAGLAEASELKGQGDFERFPEVGFVGLREVHVNTKIKELAEKTEREGVTVDVELGIKLLNLAVADVVKMIESI
ncbi:creatinine amidohydrolase [archaeon BMS3Abin16]|nr:creatinine amidohydrolase [archaeon BMS3Abin16]